MSDFSTRLKQLRKRKGLSQVELAAILDISRSTVSMWELGQREPDFDMLERLAAALNVPRGELLDDAAETPEETELWELRERLRRDPDLRMLFSLTKNATADDVRKAVAILRALKGEDAE